MARPWAEPLGPRARLREHLVERCRLLEVARGLVEEEEMREWETRHAGDKKKKKGDVGIEKEKEKEEGKKLASYFSTLHNFFVPVVPEVPPNVFVPAALRIVEPRVAHASGTTAQQGYYPHLPVAINLAIMVSVPNLCTSGSKAVQ